jgi:hypothetical protein
MPSPTLIRPSEKAAQYLAEQVEANRLRWGRHMGRGPLMEGVLEALKNLKVDFSGCASVPEVTVLVMRRMTPWQHAGKPEAK